MQIKHTMKKNKPGFVSKNKFKDTKYGKTQQDSQLIYNLLKPLYMYIYVLQTASIFSVKTFKFWLASIRYSSQMMCIKYREVTQTWAVMITILHFHH